MFSTCQVTALQRELNLPACGTQFTLDCQSRSTKRAKIPRNWILSRIIVNTGAIVNGLTLHL